MLFATTQLSSSAEPDLSMEIQLSRSLEQPDSDSGSEVGGGHASMPQTSQGPCQTSEKPVDKGFRWTQKHPTAYLAQCQEYYALHSVLHDGLCFQVLISSAFEETKFIHL